MSKKRNDDSDAADAPALQPTPHVETELKLVAPAGLGPPELIAAARAAGFSCEPSGVRRQHDRYLDTAGFDLVSAGLSLRVRVRDGEAELGLKARTQPKGRGLRAALWRRIELEIPLAPGAALPAVAAALPGSMRQRVEPYALARPLREIVATATERTVMPLHDATGARIEMTLDRVEVLGAREETFAEVEAERIEGDDEALQRLARSLAGLGLVPSAQDKLARALTRIGADPPIAPPRRLFAELPLRDASSRILRWQLEALRRAEPEARLGEDAEGVHRMRVATRRLRATLRLFRDFLPARGVFVQRRFLKRTAARLGDVRDLDVLLASWTDLLAEIPPVLHDDARALEALLRTDRAIARTRLLAWLMSPARLAAEERFERFVLASAGAVHSEATQPIGECAPALVASAAARVFGRSDAMARDASTDAVHGLRLALKRLRYAAEALEDVLPPETVTALHRMRKLQEQFGRFNDVCVAGERILAAIDSAPGRRLPRRSLVAAGAILSACETRAVVLRRELRSAWKEFARGKVRRALGADARDAGEVADEQAPPEDAP